MTLDPASPRPTQGRTYSTRRTIRLADMDARGRLRLDALARYLQDAAIEDVDETGWGMPDHLWYVRAMQVEVLEPPLADREVELVTWCNGLAAVAAGRRWSVTGEAGGRIEVDSVWIHLDPDGRPARIEDFDVYAASSNGRGASTKLVLGEPGGAAGETPWHLRSSDVDLHGHVNNAVHWQAVEHALAAGGPDPRGRLRARLEYREPIDLGDDVALAVARHDGEALLALRAGGRTRAVAAVAPLPQ